MNQVIGFEDLWKIVKKNIGLIVVTTAIGLLLAAFVSYFVMTPKYDANVDVLVNRKQDKAIANQLSDQQADVNMINTYKDIITKEVTLVPVQKELHDKLGYSISVATLMGNTAVTNQQNSQVFSITYTDTDAARSKTVANTIANVFKSKVKTILDINNVSIIAKARQPKAPSSPNKKLNMLIGLVLGLFIGLAIALLRTITDKKVKDLDFLTDELGLTKLGIVGHTRKTSRHSVKQPVLQHNNISTRQLRRSDNKPVQRVK